MKDKFGKMYPSPALMRLMRKTRCCLELTDPEILREAGMAPHIEDFEMLATMSPHVYGWYAALLASWIECSERFDLRFAEIGVRRGYSAACLTTLDSAAHLIDSDEMIPGGLEYAREQLSSNKQVRDVRTYKLNTRDLKELPPEITDIDIFHIDGNHSYEYAKHDVELAWPRIRTGGILLMDDLCYFGGQIPRVVWELCEREGVAWQCLPTYRGLAVVMKE